jgi:hypothetical protein
MKLKFFLWFQNNQKKKRQIVSEFRNFKTFQLNLIPDYFWIQEFQNFSVKPDSDWSNSNCLSEKGVQSSHKE